MEALSCLLIWRVFLVVDTGHVPLDVGQTDSDRRRSSRCQ